MKNQNVAIIIICFSILAIVFFEYTGDIFNYTFSLTSNNVKTICFFIFITYHAIILKKAREYFKNKFYLNLHFTFISIAGWNSLLLTLAARFRIEVYSTVVANYVYFGLPVLLITLRKVFQPISKELNDSGLKMDSIEAEKQFGLRKSTVVISFVYFMSSSFATLYSLIPIF
jgi:hypothetical protein